MAERIKLLELDVDFDALIKHAAASQKAIEKLKAQIKAYQKSIEQGEALQKQYAQELADLEAQGKKNTKAYESQKSKLTALKSEQEKSRIAIEKNNTQLREQTKAYRSTKSFLDNYTHSVNTNLRVVTKTNGSINQLQAALAQNRKQYRLLSQAQRKSEKIGGRLLKVIQSQDAEYKKLQMSIGTTQVNVGNYKEAIKAALGGNQVFTTGLQRASRKVPVVGEALSNLVGNLIAYKTAERGAAMATKESAAASAGFSKALKFLRIALIGTGIGAIVVALGALIAAFLSTQKGVDALNRALAPIKGAFEGIIAIAQKLAVNVFDQLKDRWKVAADDILIGITNLRMAWNKLTGDKKEAESLKVYKKQLEGEVTQAQERLSNKTQSFSKIWNNAGKEIKQAAQKQKEIERLQIEIEKGANALISKRARENEIIKQNEVIAKDRTKTAAQQQAAADRALAAARGKQKAEQAQLDLQIKQLTLKQSLTDTSREEEKELAKLQAEKINKETEYRNTEIRFLGSKRAIQQAQQQAAIKDSQARLALYIEESKGKTKTLKQELKYAETIRDKKLAILETEFEAGKKTETEYKAAKLRINKEFAQAQANAAVKHAQRELETWKRAHQSRIEQGQFLNDALYSQEVDRLEKTAEKEREYQQTRLEQGVIHQQEYNAAIDAINEQEESNKEALNKQKREDDRAQRAADFQEQMQEKQGNYLAQLNAKKAYLQQEYQTRIAQAHKQGKDTTALEHKQSKAEKEIEKEKTDYKLHIASETFGNLAELLGKHTAMGKAAAIAQTTIATYQSATKAYDAMAGIPLVGPALGAVAAAAAIASGLKTVQQIKSTKTDKKYESGGYLEGRSHREGGIPFTIAGESGFEAEGGEFIVNKRATAAFRPILEHMNKRYNIGYSAAAYLFAQGGYLNRAKSTPQQPLRIDYDSLARKIGEYTAQANLESLPNPVVSVQAINNAKGRKIEVENRIKS